MIERIRTTQQRGRRPTREDVARAVDVSGATVSRAFSARGDIQITEETRGKVLEAARRLGYRPSATAAAFTRGRTGIVGLLMSLQASRFHGQVLAALRAQAKSRGLTLAILDFDEVFADGTQGGAFRSPVDGLIAFDDAEGAAGRRGILERYVPGTPFVSMGVPWSEALSHVGVDLAAGTEMAMCHLIETGRRRIAYVAPFDSGLTAGDRFDVYRRAMADAGLGPETILPRGPFAGPLFEALTERTSRGALPDALLCLNDDLALSGAHALHRMGVSVGQDVVLVGFGGIPETEDALFPITTVRQPIEAMGALALEILEAQIEDPELPRQRRILIPELVVRDSNPVTVAPA